MKVKKLLLDILGFVSLSGPYPDVNSEDINKNIQLLKKNKWFRNLLNNEKYRSLIVHDQYVRYEIGYLNTERLRKNVHHNRYKNKIQKILDKRYSQLSNNTA